MAGLGQRRAQALARRRLVQGLALHAQRPVVAIAGHELRLQGKLAHQRGNGFAGNELLHGGKPAVAFRRGRHRLARRLGRRPGRAGRRLGRCNRPGRGARRNGARRNGARRSGARRSGFGHGLPGRHVMGRKFNAVHAHALTIAIVGVDHGFGQGLAHGRLGTQLQRRCGDGCGRRGRPRRRDGRHDRRHDGWRDGWRDTRRNGRGQGPCRRGCGRRCRCGRRR
ncbi:hypothetical protein D3C71_1551580 [compost metagenome]